jgi:hypothetical protein
VDALLDAGGSSLIPPLPYFGSMSANYQQPLKPSLKPYHPLPQQRYIAVIAMDGEDDRGWNCPDNFTREGMRYNRLII